MPLVTLNINAREETAQLPIIWRLGRKFNVVTSIRRARVSADFAYVALDVEGSTPKLGKTPGKDAVQNKPTYVSVLGLSAAKARAASLHDEAIDALERFGSRAARLAELADFILLRDN